MSSAVTESQEYQHADRGPVILGIIITFTSLSTITVAARLFTRKHFLGRIHLDDWVSLVAIVSPCCVCIH